MSVIAKLFRGNGSDRDMRVGDGGDGSDIMQAIVYDLRERTRLWNQLRSSRTLNCVHLAIEVVLVCGIFWLIPNTYHADTFGYRIHDNGDVDPLGKLRPTDPASVMEFRSVAGHLMADLYTVTIPVDQAHLKKSVMAHVARGSAASAFVSRHYEAPETNPFVTYKQSYQKVSITDVDSPPGADGSRSTVYFTVTPIDQFDTAKGPSVKHVAHVKMVQDKIGDVSMLWLNSNEIYATYIDDVISNE